MKKFLNVFGKWIINRIFRFYEEENPFMYYRQKGHEPKSVTAHTVATYDNSNILREREILQTNRFRVNFR